MKTHVECIPCFLQQTLRTLRLYDELPSVRKRILRELEVFLRKVDMNRPPVAIASEVHAIIRDMTGIEDPYFEIKRHDNRWALEQVDHLRNTEATLESVLYSAVSANAIDYGANGDFDIRELTKSEHLPVIDDTSLLKAELCKADTVAYFLDNAGEIAFDRLFIEKIIELYQPTKILAIVRNRPFINDALERDAAEVGLNALPAVRICCMPPRLPNRGDRYRKTWDEAMACDVVIAKGQANFEVFEIQDGIYFLFLVKCSLVEKYLTACSQRPVAKGDMIVWKKRPQNPAG